MHMLAAGGRLILSDGVRLPDAHNRDGYREHERVRALARDPDARAWLRAEGPGRAVKVVHGLLQHLPEEPGLRYQVLLTERDPADVVASQDRMLAAGGHEGGALSADRLAAVLAAQHGEARALLDGRPDCTCLGVDFEELLADPARVAARLDRFLGGLDVPKMVAIVRCERARASPSDRYTAPMADHRFDDLDIEVLRRRSGEKWQSYPQDVLPMWVADMDFEPAEPIRQRLQECLDVGDLGYPVHPRPTGMPQAFADRAKSKWGWQVEPRLVELITEVVQGMYVCMWQFSEPGDGVIVQPPIYPPFLSSVESLGRRVVMNPLAPSREGYQVDLDDFERKAEGARIFMLCNPHNPSGRVLRREELLGLAEIAIRHDLLVVSDEIHADLVYPGAQHLPFASLGEEVAARTITLTSASKAFNIAGLRCALAVFGSADLRRRFLGFPRHLRGGLGSLGIQATLTAWAEGDPWLADALAYLEGNRDFLADTLRRELPEVGFYPPEATYLAWLDFRSLGLEPSPYQHFLERAKVALSHGPDFGLGYEGFARINFATSRSLLTAGLDRLLDSLR
jgi:cystathionine beta-lyase